MSDVTIPSNTLDGLFCRIDSARGAAIMLADHLEERRDRIGSAPISAAHNLRHAFEDLDRELVGLENGAATGTGVS